MTCPICSSEVPARRMGAPRKYCSEACKELRDRTSRRPLIAHVGVSGRMHRRIARAAAARGVTMRELVERVLAPALVASGTAQ